jgi:hypothetical protein
MDLSGDETAITKDSSVADSADLGKNNTELRDNRAKDLLRRRENYCEKGTLGEGDGTNSKEGNCKETASHSGSAKKQQGEGKKDVGPSFKPQNMAIKRAWERKEGSQTLGNIGDFNRTGGGGSGGGGVPAALALPSWATQGSSLPKTFTTQTAVATSRVVSTTMVWSASPVTCLTHWFLQ